MSMEVFNRWLDRVPAYDDTHRPETPEPTTMIATHDSAPIDDPVMPERNKSVESTSPEDEWSTFS